MHCHGLESSLDEFLGRLSEAIGVCDLKGMAQLRSHLSASPRRMLVVDGAECILDPLSPGAAGITSAIEEFSRCQNVCLLLTSKMDVRIAGLRRIKVPKLSVNGAQDVFYSRCGLERSVEVDNILEELDSHPLSIDLLASAASENDWDEATLLEAWEGGKVSILKACGCQSLEDNIKLVLATPIIQAHGVTALKTLGVLAAQQNGVRESKLEIMFAEIAGVEDAADALCKCFLVYRKDGFLKMLSPFRLYFQASGQALVNHSGSDPVRDTVAENVRCAQRNIFDFGWLFSFCLFFFFRVTSASPNPRTV